MGHPEVQHPALIRDSLCQVFQDHVHLNSEQLRGQKVHNLSKQPVSVVDEIPSEPFLVEFPSFHLVSVASYPFTNCNSQKNLALSSLHPPSDCTYTSCVPDPDHFGKPVCVCIFCAGHSTPHVVSKVLNRNNQSLPLLC